MHIKFNTTQTNCKIFDCLFLFRLIFEMADPALMELSLAYTGYYQA